MVISKCGAKVRCLNDGYGSVCRNKKSVCLREEDMTAELSRIFQLKKEYIKYLLRYSQLLSLKQGVAV